MVDPTMPTLENHAESSSDEEDDEVGAPAAEEQPSSPTENSKQKKKKKKNKKKKAKSADADGGIGSETTAATNSSSANAPSSNRQMSIEELLRQLAVQEQPQKKTMEDYKFWKTQPVTKFDEKIDDEGPIEGDKTPDDIPNTPYPLLNEFEWDTMDLANPDVIKEIFDLLYGNYVEDSDSTFRFNYSPRFLDWALRAPDFRPEWHVGVRVSGTKKLVAFISGIPVRLRVRNTTITAAEINFLCIHKKLRSKRLAPLLIKEVTRRVNKQGIWQALYTAGVVLPKPVSTCRYYHRSLNWSKLNEVGFSPLPPGTTKAKMIAKYKLPINTSIPGLRLMRRDDIGQVYDLLVAYLNKFELAPVFGKEELLHWLMHDYGTESVSNDEKDKDRVVWAYVVENADGLITDLVSFYSLPSTVIGNPTHDNLLAAYQFYYASTAGLALPRTHPECATLLKNRLLVLFNDALVLAKNLGFDVFNALTLLDNPLFLDDIKFGAGDGYLNYYLFNYKAFPIDGGYREDGKLEVEKRSGVGVIML
ncbi:acyl-CoA N-acyltransferase [Lipomyces kononenkoae]|uniref:Acyl-CoA N-acyltransferase n=1 Tax=Lipomyces kononenkoae TaxID=34357 RepID=A0ACC3T670_LIPKO